MLYHLSLFQRPSSHLSKKNLLMTFSSKISSFHISRVENKDQSTVYNTQNTRVWVCMQNIIWKKIYLTDFFSFSRKEQTVPNWCFHVTCCYAAVYTCSYFHIKLCLEKKLTIIYPKSNTMWRFSNIQRFYRSTNQFSDICDDQDEVHECLRVSVARHRWILEVLKPI